MAPRPRDPRAGRTGSVGPPALLGLQQSAGIGLTGGTQALATRPAAPIRDQSAPNAAPPATNLPSSSTWPGTDRCALPPSMPPARFVAAYATGAAPGFRAAPPGFGRCRRLDLLPRAAACIDTWPACAMGAAAGSGRRPGPRVPGAAQRAGPRDRGLPARPALPWSLHCDWRPLVDRRHNRDAAPRRQRAAPHSLGLIRDDGRHRRREARRPEEAEPNSELPQLGVPVPSEQPVSRHDAHLVVELRPSDTPAVATEADELGCLPVGRSGHAGTRVHQSLLSSAGQRTAR